MKVKLWWNTHALDIFAICLLGFMILGYITVAALMIVALWASGDYFLQVLGVVVLFVAILWTNVFTRKL